MLGPLLRRNTAALRRINVKRQSEQRNETKAPAQTKRFVKPSPLILSLLVIDIIPPLPQATKATEIAQLIA